MARDATSGGGASRLFGSPPTDGEAGARHRRPRPAGIRARPHGAGTGQLSRTLFHLPPYLFGELRWDRYAWWVDGTLVASAYHS